MNLSEIRSKAREALKGKWKKVVVIALIQAAIIYGAQLISNLLGGVLSIAVTICAVPIEFGLYISYMKIFKNEEVDYTDFLKDGFKNFGKAWGIVGNTLLKMWPILLAYFVSLIIFIISVIVVVIGATTSETSFAIFGIVVMVLSVIGLYVSMIWMIIRGLLYSLAYYVAIDNPEITTKQAVEESEKMMKGNRGKLFLLNLSFIGWGILAIITIGIGSLWLLPYMIFSEIIFYQMLKSKTEKVEVITEN